MTRKTNSPRFQSADYPLFCKPMTRLLFAAPLSLAARGLPAARLLLAVLFAFSATCPAGADVVTLNNGDELFGTILGISSAAVEFDKNGERATFPIGTVLKTEFDSYRMIEGETTPEKITDPLVRATLDKMPTENEYPQGSLVEILDEDRYDVEENGSFSVTSHEIYVVLKERARETANRSFTYFPDIADAEILYGRSITPSKGGVLGLFGGKPGRVMYVSDRTIADEADFPTVPLYQRRHTVKFAIPEVNPGTIVDRKYRVSRKKVDPLRPFLAKKLFRSSEYKKLSRLVVAVPEGKTLMIEINAHGIPVSSETRKVGGKTEHIFQVENSPPITSEPDLPSLERFVPSVTCAIADDWKSSVKILAGLVEEAAGSAARNDLFRNFLDSATAGKKNPREVIEGIFLALGKEIARVPVSPEAFSWKPLDPVRILKEKQAGILDRVVLYYSLLKASGVGCRLFLARPSDAGPIAWDVPSFRQGQFLGIDIASAPGALRWNIPLDGTRSPHNLPALVQGAQGVYLDDGSRVEVPFASPEAEGEEAGIEASLSENGTLDMTIRVLPKGGIETSWRSLKNSKREEIRVILEQAIGSQYPGSKLGEFELSDLQDLMTPISITLKVRIPDFAVKSGEEFMVFPVPLESEEYSAAAVGAPVRFSPMAWPTWFGQKKKISVRLPPGYSIYALPLGVSASMDGLGYACSFGFEVDKVTFEDSFRRTRDFLGAEDYPAYKRLVEARSQAPERMVVIQKKK